MKNNIIANAIVLLLLVCSLSCKKEFLDKKPSTNLNVPNTLSDIQMLLDNVQELNFSVGLGELSADDFFMEYSSWNNQYAPFYSNAYIWSKDIFVGQGEIPDWNQPYKTILTANVALEQINKIQRTQSNGKLYDELKSMALFLRSYMLFDLAQVFAPPYDESTANVDLGIPLRLEANISRKTTRATLRETYDQILADITLARELMQTNYSANNLNRPSKASIYGFMSRVYLNMRMYEKAGLYADSSLSLHNKLIDYNTINVSSRLPFTITNDELLFPCFLTSNNPIFSLYRSQGYSIDTSLYKSYKPNDLRKQIFFAVNGKSINRKGGCIFRRKFTSIPG